MTMKRESELGNIIITPQAIASLTAATISTCYGVVGMAGKNFIKDHVAELLNKQNYARGVFVKNTDKGIELDVYIILGYGVKVTEVTKEVQRKVKFQLENTFDIVFAAVNVYVQAIKNLD